MSNNIQVNPSERCWFSGGPLPQSSSLKIFTTRSPIHSPLGPSTPHAPCHKSGQTWILGSTRKQDTCENCGGEAEKDSANFTPGAHFLENKDNAKDSYFSFRTEESSRPLQSTDMSADSPSDVGSSTSSDASVNFKQEMQRAVSRSEEYSAWACRAQRTTPSPMSPEYLSLQQNTTGISTPSSSGTSSREGSNIASQKARIRRPPPSERHSNQVQRLGFSGPASVLLTRNSTLSSSPSPPFGGRLGTSAEEASMDELSLVLDSSNSRGERCVLVANSSPNVGPEIANSARHSFGCMGSGGDAPPHRKERTSFATRKAFQEISVEPFSDMSSYCPAACTPRGSRRNSPDSSRVEFLLPNELDVMELAAAIDEGTVDSVRRAIKNVRASLKGSFENKTRLIEAGMVGQVMSLLDSEDEETSENAITSIFNICQIDAAKAEIVAGRGLERIVQVLRSANLAARENAAATLFCLSDSVENKDRICAAGALPLLVEIVRRGGLRGKKDAALALFTLSRGDRRLQEVVEAGGVGALLEAVERARDCNAHGLEEKAIAVLAYLAKSVQGREELQLRGGIEILVDVMDMASQRAREDAVGALLLLACHNSNNLKVLVEAGIFPALRRVIQKGSPRACSKAKALLELLEKRGKES